MPDRLGDRGGEGSPPDPIRLQLFLARAGLASRRAAELLILQGKIRVNGAVVTALGTKVSLEDRVSFEGRELRPEGRKRYILLNKPAGHICAMSDPEGRPLAIDLIKEAVRERVYNVGRLDQWSSGLLLFTNDGELASRLVHPSGGIEKEYEVITDSPLGEDLIRTFVSGIEVGGVRYKAASALRIGVCSARIVLIEGKNREIRRVLEDFGLRPTSLRRIRIGPLFIGDLKEGAYRELTPAELEALRRKS